MHVCAVLCLIISVTSSDAMRGSVIAYRIKMNIIFIILLYKKLS